MEQTNSKQKQQKLYNGKYLRIKKINEGSFGKIILCSVKDSSPTEYRVLKKFKLSRSEANIDINSIKEVSIMEKLNHPNLLKSDDVFKASKSYNGEDFFEQVFMQLPFCLEMSEAKREELSTGAIRILVRQLVQAVAYLHAQKIIHRDIKPSNLFVNESGTLQLGDMGIAREFPKSKNEDLTGNVVTRLYRAPEILFGSKRYDESIDSWSLGCTIAEFFLESKKYFFSGKSEIDQLCKVFEVRGAANEENWKGCTELPYFMDFGDLSAQNLQVLVPKAPAACIEIIDSLLQLDPKKRATPQQVLDHEWLSSHEEEEVESQKELQVFAVKYIEQNIAFATGKLPPKQQETV